MCHYLVTVIISFTVIMPSFDRCNEYIEAFTGLRYPLLSSAMLVPLIKLVKLTDCVIHLAHIVPSENRSKCLWYSTFFLTSSMNWQDTFLTSNNAQLPRLVNKMDKQGWFCAFYFVHFILMHKIKWTSKP